MRTMKKTMCLYALCLAAALAAAPGDAFAAEDVSAPVYLFDTRIYQVLTGITGSGLNSRTLQGMNGWLQIIHQKLDDTELVMDGATLTWNGQPCPDNPRIIQLATPKIITREGEDATLAVGSKMPVQYMNRQPEGLFELQALEPDIAGLSLSLTPVNTGADNLLSCDLSFTYSWVKEREQIKGVNLEVGRPAIGKAAGEGAVQMRLGEWSCYQVPVESEGWIFLFLRAKQEDGKAAQALLQGREDAKELSAEAKEKAVPPEKESNGPKIEVGGSVRMRGTVFSGGGK